MKVENCIVLGDALPNAKSKKIQNIEDLILKGDYQEAITLSEIILKNKSSSKLERIYANLLNGKTIYFLRNSEDRSELIEEAMSYFENAALDSNQQESVIPKLEANFWVLVIQNELRKREAALKTIEKIEGIFEKSKSKEPLEIKQANAIKNTVKALKLEIEFSLGMDSPENRIEKQIKHWKKSVKLYQELDFKIEIIYCLVNISKNYFFVGDFQKTLKEREMALKISREMGNKYIQSDMLKVIAYGYFRSGESEKMPDCIDEYMKLDEELGNEFAYGSNQNLLSIYYFAQGDWDKLLDILKVVVEFYESYDQKKNLIHGYFNTNVVYMLRGEIDKSLEFLLKSQKVKEELDVKGPSASITDIATIYYLKGELEKAQKMIEEEIEVCEQFEDKPALVYNFPIFSAILYQQGKVKEALKVREHLLKLYEEMGNKRRMGRTLGDIIILCVDLNEYELAKQHLIRFKTIVDEIDNKLLLRAYHSSEAMVLKTSQQRRDRIKAEVLFEQLLEEDLSYQFRVNVLLNLSELLLVELHETNDETILEKVKKHVKSLYDFAVSNNSQLLKVQSLWLQAQIAMIELDIEKAQSLLTKAQKIVEEKGLKRLESKITSESIRLKELTFELIEAGKKNFSISKRMELVKIQNGVKEIKIKRFVEDALEDISTTKKLFSISF